MPWFRARTSTSSSPIHETELQQIIEIAIGPGQFFVAPSLNLTWDSRTHETTHWELFRGQALDQTQTRKQCTFETWSIREHGGPPRAEPLIAVRLDRTTKQIHVTRSIACHGFESYSEGNAILSRETVRRVRELLGSINLNRLTTAAEVQDELIALLFFAVVGTSRLPLTSLEAPLPEFTFGRLGYCWRPNAGAQPIRSIEEWLASTVNPETSAPEFSRLLEVSIRVATASQIPAIADHFVSCWAGIGRAADEIIGLFREMFNSVALSPYTDFAHNAQRFLRCLVASNKISVANEVDLLTHLLRQLGRHLTSFDLVRFHHRGANYPDALLLDEVLSRVLEMVDVSPGLFLANAADDATEAKQKRLRRRGLRSAWLIRRQYQGYPVPDAPTSPGENARLMPESFPRVPEEQIINLGKRTRRLFLDSRFDASASVREALRQSVADIAHRNEALELGIGLFLDRPFGIAKQTGEPDRTTLLSHEAFSELIARTRLDLLQGIGQVPNLSIEPGPGVPSRNLASVQRPGVASVRDAHLSAEDSVYLRTTRRAVRDLLHAYDFSPLRESGLLDWLQSERCLILPSEESPTDLVIHDSGGHERVLIRMDVSQGFVCRAGTETLAAGLVVASAFDQSGNLIPNLSDARLPSQN